MKKFNSESFYQITITILAILIVATSVFPLIYALGMSLTGKTEMIARHYFVLIPHNPTISSYEAIFKSSFIGHALFISVIRSASGVLLMLIMTVTGAFVLSVKTLPGRSFFLLMVLATILLNGGLIPTYLVVKQLHLLDSLWPLILLYMVDSFGLLVIKIFIENIPDSLIESAEIDGADKLQLLLRIVIPLAAPALAAIGLFNVVFHWNSWFDAMIYLNNAQLFPFQLILKNMIVVDGINAAKEVLQSQLASTPESLKMATVLVGMLPILCVYPFLQKYFVKGMYLGAVKG